MADGDVHTYYEDGLWKNRVEGGRRASNTSPRRVDAVLAGRQIARKRRVGHFVHTPEGDVETERDFRPGARRTDRGDGAQSRAL
ncbi:MULTISPECIES: DUF2188 domain-containing protein [unclassified Amycolatopsis]|uniref:DUF2188 domain-containing protein n=1 Tax=unclassified Amycolatopsis TaxID=2618356 RepID=UPI000CD17DE2|nr:DUF2188 domain-containing protein [Amycolatopsis sp. CA-126428]